MTHDKLETNPIIVNMDSKGAIDKKVSVYINRVSVLTL